MISKIQQNKKVNKFKQNESSGFHNFCNNLCNLLSLFQVCTCTFIDPTHMMYNMWSVQFTLTI